MDDLRLCGFYGLGKQLTEGSEKGGIATYLGINHFNEIEESPLNVISILFLTFWMQLKEAPKLERAQYGYEKMGGQFIARRGQSVYHATDQDVFQLLVSYWEFHSTLLRELNELEFELGGEFRLHHFQVR